MKQSRLFPSVSLSFIVIVLFVTSHLSASVTFWDDFDPATNSNYNSLYRRQDNYTIPKLDLYEFNIYKILWINDSVQLYSNPDEIQAHALFHDMLKSKTFLFVPDEHLTQQIISNALNTNQTSEWQSDMRSAPESAGDVAINNNADTKSMRTPAPGSLLLVAIGLLSLRFTRRLRY
jgi:hypothetical protein